MLEKGREGKRASIPEGLSNFYCFASFSIPLARDITAWEIVEGRNVNSRYRSLLPYCGYKLGEILHELSLGLCIG